MNILVSIIKLILVFIVFTCNANNHNSSKAKSNNSIHTTASYIGSQQCLACHAKQYKAWSKSHHDLSMQPAIKKYVLGNFNNAVFKYFKTVSKFYKKENKFFVQTDGPDGKLIDYPIEYVIGAYPLQQYLVKFPGGRYQVLSIAWDSRSPREGGQHWFHLHPNEYIKHNDELHWTGINQNWNYMCADCHSTNLKKKYDISNKQYNTSWSEVNIGCEACHGPASLHILWSTHKSINNIKNKGFSIEFEDTKNNNWVINSITGNSKPKYTINSNTEINLCAQCHSLRSTYFSGAKPNTPLLNNFRPELLTDSLYFPDGQIKGEVYEYGSFVQSKMYHSGVTCSNCHNPHSLKLRVKGNKLCTQCHLSSKFDSKRHHMHKQGSEGAQCVNCHMPDRKYMVIDSRRDHSLKIPRPDLSMSLNTPNACTQCHIGKTALWATNKLKKNDSKPIKKGFAKAIYAGRYNLPEAEKLLYELLFDVSQPAIARATAITLLASNTSQLPVDILQKISNDEPLLNYAVAISLNSIKKESRWELSYSLLHDNMRSIRLITLQSLYDLHLQNIPIDIDKKYKQTLEEYISALKFNADRPESLVNLANFHLLENNSKEAEKFYWDAITLAPYYTPAYLNLVNYYRSSGNDTQGELILKKALLYVREKAPIYHALGLLYVRQKKYNDALKYLKLAAVNGKSIERYMYIYAIALHSFGYSEQSLIVLEQARQKHPESINIIKGLILIYSEQGNDIKKKFYQNILDSIIPGL